MNAKIILRIGNIGIKRNTAGTKIKVDMLQVNLRTKITINNIIKNRIPKKIGFPTACESVPPIKVEAFITTESI